jgi:hypothetical protein
MMSMKIARNPFLVLACVACVSTSAVSTSAWSADTDEHELAEKDVPAAVLKTMKTAAAEGTELGEFESEKKDNKEVYTATFHTKAQVEMEITVLPDGTLVSVKPEDDNDAGHHDGEHAGKGEDHAEMPAAVKPASTTDSK